MRSAINLLLATLAFSDIMLCLCCMPFTAVTLVTVHWHFGDSFCRLSAALYWFFVLEGVSILLIVSVDRFLIIAQRQDRLNPRRAKVIIAASWALSFCVSAPALAGWTLVEVPARAPQCVLGYTELPAGRAYVLTLVGAAFFIPFAVMLGAHLGVLHAVRKNAVRVHNQSERLDLRRLPRACLRRLRRQQQEPRVGAARAVLRRVSSGGGCDRAGGSGCGRGAHCSPCSPACCCCCCFACSGAGPTRPPVPGTHSPAALGPPRVPRTWGP